MGARQAASIAYLGSAGSTPDALDAVEMLLTQPEYLRSVRIVTASGSPVSHHALICTNHLNDLIAVKSGFASGYAGSGSHWFSFALGLLAWHGIELDEVEATAAALAHIDSSALGERELARLLAAPPIRPTRLWNYVQERHYPRDNYNPWAERRAVVPWALIDHRLAPLAKEYWADSDAALLKGHRLLEQLIRARLAISDDEAAAFGPSKLYAHAFNGDNAPLYWSDVTSGERQARVGLFISCVGAFRNVRSHRGGPSCSHERLRELLILNHLFHLEATSLTRS